MVWESTWPPYLPSQHPRLNAQYFPRGFGGQIKFRVRTDDKQLFSKTGTNITRDVHPGSAPYADDLLLDLVT